MKNEEKSYFFFFWGVSFQWWSKIKYLPSARNKISLLFNKQRWKACPLCFMNSDQSKSVKQNRKKKDSQFSCDPQTCDIQRHVHNPRENNYLLYPYTLLILQLSLDSKINLGLSIDFIKPYNMVGWFVRSLVGWFYGITTHVEWFNDKVKFFFFFFTSNNTGHSECR